MDAFWLDIKARNDEKHRWPTGCSNGRILKLPEEILKRGFTPEVLSLYVPDLVESDERQSIARDLSDADATIPFTILAFSPEHRVKNFWTPNVREMVGAQRKVKSTGLKNIRLGNLVVFVRNDEDRDYLTANVDMSAA